MCQPSITIRSAKSCVKPDISLRARNACQYVALSLQCRIQTVLAIHLGFAIKEPVFSFDKFPEVNKELGPEMKSTGEAIRFIPNIEDPYFRHLYKEKSMYLSK